MKLVSNGQAMAPVQEKLGTDPEKKRNFHGENYDAPVGFRAIFRLTP